jgi:polyphosphate kinase
MGSVIQIPTLPNLLTSPGSPLIHRDLSWLQFNERVLAEAQLESSPLLERVKFLGISSNNLDEFFMIRYASLVRSIHSASRNDKKSALHLLRIRNNILEAVHRFSQKQSKILNQLSFNLSSHRIFLDRTLGKPARARIFENEILPKLGAPEPFSFSKLHQLENLQVGVIYPNRFWFRIPKALPLFYSAWDKESESLSCFFLDEILFDELGRNFNLPHDPVLVRLTRDSDFTADLHEEDPETIPDIVRMSLGRREKGRPVRLQYRGKTTKEFLNSTAHALKLTASQLVSTRTSLVLHGVSSIRNALPESITNQAGMSYPPLISITPKPFLKADQIFDRLDQKDLLLHHPYDSFDAYVCWIRAACQDPHVTQIQQTVYRMDTLSPVIEALKQAAPHKKVRVVIELRARFDELNNLKLADELRKAGVEVAFGFGKLKLHGKVALVTRQVGDHIKLYAHLSTGNYHATTARQYTDLAILTANPTICMDVHHFFETVLQGKIPTDFKSLISAPTKLHRRLLAHIQAEIEAARRGEKARIVAKVNALVDDSVILQLYQASQAGVQVDLIVRGACSLIPGLKGLSENIRVVSIIDRFLEHSRIYYFSHAQAIYLSSADWMPRNFFSRLELAFPILDPDIYRYIERFIIPLYLADTVKSRELTPEGKWKRRKNLSGRPESLHTLNQVLSPGEKNVRSQFLLEEVANREYLGTPLWRRYDE